MLPQSADATLRNMLPWGLRTPVRREKHYFYVMKSASELKLDLIVKEGFHAALKPVGFRKKGNNFYRQLKDLGHIVNIQKSQWGSKNDIQFTINCGIFSPEYWRGLSYNEGKEVPEYPVEPSCLLRKRIGELRHKGDTWYEVNEIADETNLIDGMKENIDQYILPWFNKIQSTQDFITVIKQENRVCYPIGKLIVFGELKMLDDAKSEYQKLLGESKWSPEWTKMVQQYGRKYGIEIEQL